MTTEQTPLRIHFALDAIRHICDQAMTDRHYLTQLADEWNDTDPQIRVEISTRAPRVANLLLNIGVLYGGDE